MGDKSIKNSNLSTKTNFIKSKSDTGKNQKTVQTKKNIFNFFSKNPSTEKKIYKDSFEIRLPGEKYNQIKNNNNNEGGKLFSNLMSLDKTNKNLMNKTLSTNKKSIDMAKSSISNDCKKTQETTSVFDNKPYISLVSTHKSQLNISKVKESNCNSLDKTVEVSKNNKLSLDKTVYSNTQRINEKTAVTIEEKKQLTSLDFDNPNVYWFKNQMIQFLNKIPKCQPKRPTRSIAFEWLSSYLNYLSIKFINNNFFLTRDTGQLFCALNENVCIQIIHYAAEIFESESMLLELKLPKKKKEIIVVSDIHGSIADVMRAFNNNGIPGDSTYLFLGDYVDKGDYEIEVVMLLFILKICFPTHIYLLRGNHEFPEQNKKFCFPGRCKKQFSSHNYWKILNFAFDRLSVAAIIENEIYCAHGGVSQWIHGRHSIRNLKKPMHKNNSIIERLILTDIVWGDTIRCDIPDPNHHFIPTIRGLGYSYTEKGLKKILKLLNVKKIIRGHHPHFDGFFEEYKNICYTVHARQIEPGSTGSTCKIYKDPVTLKIIIKGQNYKVDEYFKDLEAVGRKISDMRYEYILRKSFFLKIDSKWKLKLETKNDNKVRGKKVFFDESAVEKSNMIECTNCSNYNDLIKECYSRDRFFVSHQQIYILMIQYQFPRLIADLYDFNTFDDKFDIYLKLFPVFFDFVGIYPKRIRTLLTSFEKYLVKQLASNSKDLNPPYKKLVNLEYTIFSYLKYYEMVSEEEADSVPSTKKSDEINDNSSSDKKMEEKSLSSSE